ncbi:MAG: PLP-dependent transferase [Polyangiaceae bacterium]|nr:PLP-dependent transferase [Polyangiaceae bacterium]
MNDDELHPDTVLAHGGTQAATTGHVTPPIAMSTTFGRDRDQGLIVGGDYIRDASPSYKDVERALIKLEGGTSALLFASGMAAATAIFSNLAPGDHVVIPSAMYWGLRKWVLAFGARWNVEVSVVDAWDPANLRAAVRPGKTKLVWIETPANPTWEVTDVAESAAIAHGCGAVLGVDSTAATPLFTRPLDLGADIVMHSATKYLNGHSDVLAGILVTRQSSELWDRIAVHRHDSGAVLGPFDAWLLLRGLRTLRVRVERQSATALELARWLEQQPAISRVRYPGLPSHPQYEIARRQMSGGFGGMMSIQLRGGKEAALRVASRLEVFLRATSLGGTESLVEHRATAEGQGSMAPPDLLRLSIGLEHIDDLRRDLERALV